MEGKDGMPIPTVSDVYTRGSCKPANTGRIAEALGVDVTEIRSRYKKFKPKMNWKPKSYPVSIQRPCVTFTGDSARHPYGT